MVSCACAVHKGGYRGGASGRPPPLTLSGGGHRPPPLGPQKERFVPLFPVQENNITNTIFFILIRFRLKELKRNKKGQNIAQGEAKFAQGGAKIFRALRAPSFVPNSN